MKPFPLVALIGLALVSGVAFAQWQWIGNDGQKIFSDRAPPPDIPAKNILKQPGGKPKTSDATSDAARADGSVAGSVPKEPTNTLRLSGFDKDLEAKKKMASDAQTAARKADEERLAKSRADNCNRARQGKATYDSGTRIARTNASGEREIMDDTARAAEVKRIQTIIDSDCK